jgi:hypothetical protein
MLCIRSAYTSAEGFKQAKVGEDVERLRFSLRSSDSKTLQTGCVQGAGNRCTGLRRGEALGRLWDGPPAGDLRLHHHRNVETLSESNQKSGCGP